MKRWCLRWDLKVSKQGRTRRDRGRAFQQRGAEYEKAFLPKAEEGFSSVCSFKLLPELLKNTAKHKKNSIYFNSTLSFVHFPFCEESKVVKIKQW